MSRISSVLFAVGLLGCVPEIRVAPRDAPEDLPAALQQTDVLFSGDHVVPTADVPPLTDTVPFDALLGDDRVEPDVLDVGIDVVDAGVAMDVVTMSDVPSAPDVLVDSGMPDIGCPTCLLPNAATTCRSGACAIDRCDVGFGDCNGIVADGCETSLSSSPNCGACGSTCGSGVCSLRTCVRQRSCPVDSERGCGLLASPGARFEMGAAESSTAGVLRGWVTVSAVVTDTHEVTVRRFRRFWEAGHPVPPSAIRYPNGSMVSVGVVSEPVSPISGSHCNWTFSAGVREDHPINCVDWATAQSFCVWDGGRLPTEAEWEYLARRRTFAGSSSPRTFPWGETPPIEMSSIYPRPTPCERAQFQDCLGDDGARTRRVGSFSASGDMFDLAGNVVEWTADNPGTYGISSCWSPVPVDFHDPLCISAEIGRSLRGGSFRAGGAETLMCASRDIGAVTSREEVLGFRCVRSP